MFDSCDARFLAEAKLTEQFNAEVNKGTQCPSDLSPWEEELADKHGSCPASCKFRTVCPNMG